jgi:serine/threonine protein kinase/tetratricopeptide (TPR) repeat protein
MPGVAEKSPLGQTRPYRLVELLGEGGMGRVHRAEHLETGAEVALKTVNRMSPERTLALRMEISALRAVDHPGVVKILDEGIENGLPWYAMELLRGETLAAYNRTLWDSNVGQTHSGITANDGGTIGETPSLASAAAPQSPKDSESASSVAAALTRTLRLYRDLCEPLAHIHRRGMVHRDLKPSNVFITSSGRVVLMDFGLFAYVTGGVGREIIDAGERAVGTIHYLAPERIEGRQGDARADLYALGCMLYETLTGRPPFVGSARDVMAQHVSAAPIPPSELVDGVPRVVEEFVLALLTKAPQTRLGHASDVAALLDDALGDRGVSQRSGGVALLYRPELSGREEVLHLLDTCLRAAISGSGSLVLLRGESGIGKTFLVSELAFRAARAGFRVVTGECAPGAVHAKHGSQVPAGPLHPLRRLLQAFADLCQEADPAEQDRVLGGGAAYLAPFDATLAAFAARGGSAAPEALPGPAAAERVISVLGETLREFARTEPVLLVIDDLQWADHLSLDFLGSLNNAFFQGLPLVVLGTFRSDEASAPLETLVRSKLCTCVSLHRLDERAATTMVGDMLAMADPPDHLVRFLLRQSEGNPFFIAEYLRYLVTTGHLTRKRGHWEIKGARNRAEPDYDSVQVPTSLQDLVLRRLEALSADARRATHAAAVLGRQFDLEVLSAVTDIPGDRLLTFVREAQEREVFETTESGVFRFVHDKLREAAYGAMPASEAAALHARAAAALEFGPAGSEGTDRQRSDIARHYKLAGNLRKALDLFEGAGDEAVAKSAQKDAAGCFREALQIAGLIGGVSDAKRARWERELGAALYDSGEVVESARHLETALSLLGRPMPSRSSVALGSSLVVNLFVQAGHRLFPYKILHHRVDDSERLLESARAFDRLQQGFYYAGDALPMLYACVRTLNLAELARPSPELTIAYANAYAVAGVLPARRLVEVYRRRALENMRAAPDPAAETYFLMLSGVYLTGIGSSTEATTTLSRGLSIAKRLNYARRIREITGALAIGDFLAGNYAAAITRANALHAVAVQNDPQNECWALLSRAQVLLVQGKVEDALRDVRAAAGLVAALGKPERIWSLSLESAAQLRLGDFSVADETSRRALDQIRGAPPVNHYTIDAHAACAEVRLALARRSAARGGQHTGELLRLARDASRALAALVRVFPVAEPRSRLVEGFLNDLKDDHERAARCFRASQSAAKRLGMRYEEARAYLSLASLRGTSEPQMHRRRALEMLCDLGADVSVASPP